jgi:predicted flap endonuclease-1-like 5' DNA nuclease
MEGRVMNPIIAFILGLLIGWLVEWIIDWLYWRKMLQQNQESLKACQDKQKDLDNQIKTLITENEELKKQLKQTNLQATAPNQSAEPIVSPTPDKLQKIKGIGPVIEKKLNEAGVYTFEQLASKNAEYLREVLGAVIERLADEDVIIQQAQLFADQKQSKAG